MKTDREKRICLMRCTGHALYPVSQQDDEILMELSKTQDIEVSFKQRRSNPQLRRYWVMLADVVKATECYPTAERLHEALKFDMGYVTPQRTMRGVLMYAPDSVAFSRMGADEFKGFFDRAVRLISETYGIDPLALEEMAA